MFCNILKSDGTGLTNTYRGLLINEKIATHKGLDLFGVRFVGHDWHNIGHLSLLDMLIKLQKLNLLSHEKRIVYFRRPASNPCYLHYWSDLIPVYYISQDDYNALDFFCKEIFEHLSCLKLRQGYSSLYSAWNVAQRSWEKKKLPALLCLKNKDRERGYQVFRKLSIPQDAWFVALHVREGDQRPTRSNANAEVHSYLKAIKLITDRGGWVVRMGHPGMAPLPKIEKVIDYANSEYKSDWMDVFLWATCRFLIGTASGPLSVPPTFGKPVLYTNCPCIGINPYFKNSLMLPKLYYSNNENRYFSFSEIMDSGLGWTVSTKFENIDCTIIDNTPDEIESSVIEMLNITKPCESPHEMSDLQISFNKLRNKYGDTGQMTLSNSFAEKYSELF